VKKETQVRRTMRGEDTDGIYQRRELRNSRKSGEYEGGDYYNFTRSERQKGGGKKKRFLPMDVSK